MSFAILKMLAAVLGAMAVSTAAAAPRPSQPRTPQAHLAVEFLSLLESGKAANARAMLRGSVAQLYSADKLAALARRSKPVAGKVRQIRSEGAISPGQALVNVLAARTSPARKPFPSYIVCFADVPVSGYGAVTYVAVVLVADYTRLNWQVSDFRYQSVPDRNCER